jgi:hypothetical protein
MIPGRITSESKFTRWTRRAGYCGERFIYGKWPSGDYLLDVRPSDDVESRCRVGARLCSDPQDAMRPRALLPARKRNRRRDH